MSTALRRLGEKFGARAELYKPQLAWLAWAALGFLAGRANLLDSLKPFGAPFVAACGAAACPILPAALGVCLGVLSQGFNILNAAVLVPPLLVFFALFAVNRSGKTLSIGWGGLLVLAARLVYLPMRPLLFYYVMQFLVETGMALTAYWALATVVTNWREGKALTAAGPLVCLSICAGILLAGVPGGEWFSVRHMLAMALTFAAAQAGGAAGGAAGGLAIGLVIALSGGTDTLFSGALGVCGLLSGVFRPLKRFGMTGGFWLGAILMSAWATNLTQAAVPWWEMMAASAGFLLIPARAWMWLEMRMNRGEADDETSRELKIARMRDTVVRKMTDFSKCLSELADVFGETAAGGDSWEDVAPMLEGVAADVCQKCSRRERCWQQEFYATYAQFLKALSAPGRRRVLMESDFPPEFRESCRQFPEIAAALKSAWGLYRVKTGYRRRIDESRALAGKQLKGISEVMEKLAAQFNLQVRESADLSLIVREALREAGAVCRAAQVQEGRSGISVRITVRPCGGRRKCRGYEEALSRALGRPVRRTCTACDPTDTACRLEFTEARAMRVTCSGVQRAKDGGTCGDACVWDALDESSYFIAISDGMGAGARAATESQATLSLVRRFYQAGFAEDVIYDTINQVMLLRSSGETFSTVDLCMLNLIDGEANFIKIGAPPTFILRRGQVLQVASPTLPLGILDEISPGAVKRILEDGDVIVMVSDGITQNEDTEWLEEALLSLADCEPRQLAVRLMEFAEMRYSHMDDMTVVAARVRLPRTMEFAGKKARKRLVRWRARVEGG